MKIAEVCAFDVERGEMPWPWFAFDATGTRFAYFASATEVASQSYEGTGCVLGPSFILPADVVGAIEGFALHRGGATLAVIARVGEQSVLVVCGPDGDVKRIDLEPVLGASFHGRALAYDRKGEHLWISGENSDETVVALVDARTLLLVGISRGRAFPPPANHELHLHPVDDAVLLLASCGQDGTFARVVGFTADGVATVATKLDDGAVSAGFVGFSADTNRVHLAEADELRTHAWPSLEELSSIELADDFISNYSGVVFGQHILVDGCIEGGDADAVMMFEAAAIYGKVLAPPVPFGMWAGRIGRDALVTVDHRAKPVRGRVVRVTLDAVTN